MKNYYEILGIDPDATTEEITKAYRRIAKAYSKKHLSYDELEEATAAYRVLSDPIRRDIYDENLNEEIENEVLSEMEFEENETVEDEEVKENEECNDVVEYEGNNLVVYKNKSWFQKHKLKLVAGVLIGAMFFIGYSCGKDNKQDKPESSIVDINKEDLTINADNFDEKVSNIVKENHEKGLDIKEEIVRSALLLVNLDNLSFEDLEKLANGINMQTELQNLLNYISMVETHNVNSDKYIPLYTLAHNELDRAMLKELDSEYTDLVKDINNTKLSEKELSNSIKSTINYVYEFAIGSGSLELTNGSYSKLNLNSGAGLLSESYVNLIANEVRNVTTNEYKMQIDAIAENTNGLSYINDIYKTEIPCQEEKTLTK